ncbi:MAG: hypothetical protein HUK22_03960, partial [Thermoguttaceae bacterium]|nr:hypothetical protein [Thermoguttaceae bacterium]
MKKRLITPLLAAALPLLFAAAACGADIKTIHQSWANDAGRFGEMSAEIGEMAELNLLDFPGAKLVVADQVDSPQYLTDGSAGALGGAGRVGINGTPSRVVFYLGRPYNISSIRIFSGNIDARGNQDFEVRVANNAGSPGVQPKFPENPTFTSGDKVLGGNGGGFMTAYEKEDGSLLFDKTYDWIEFKFWRTYNVKAGEPGKAKSAADSWGSMVELQVLGDPNDKNLFESEEARREWLAVRAARRLERELNKLGPDLAFAVKNLNSLKLAIENLIDNYPDEFEDAGYLERWEEFRDKFANVGDNPDDVVAL